MNKRTNNQIKTFKKERGKKKIIEETPPKRQALDQNDPACNYIRKDFKWTT